MDTITYWHWWIIAIALMGVEVFAPSTYFMWMGIAAAVVGVVLLIAPDLSWEYQLIVFGVLSVVSIAWWRSYQKKNPVTTDHPSLNQRDVEYVGKIFTVVEPIENGSGRIQVLDSLRYADGPDCEAGTKVRVTEVKGNRFNVEKV